MKFKKIYTFPLAILAVLFFLSNSAGPGTAFNRQVTGAPGSIGNMGTCGNTGCHASGAFEPTVTIELLSGTDVVDKYSPGNPYTLRITAAGTGNPSRFGFQAVALDDSDAQAGEWTSLGAGIQEIVLSNRNYVEHASPSLNGTFEMEWKAPAAGAGNVTFYTAANAVNGNGNANGDGTAAGTLTIEEDLPNSTFDLNGQLAKMDVFPNPVGEQLTVEVVTQTSGLFDLRVVDVTGSIVQTEKVNLSAGVNREQFDVTNLPAGLYILHLSGETHVTATQMLKK